MRRVFDRIRQRALLSVPSAAAFLNVTTLPVLAEVCDKSVGESWRLEHGPVWLLNPVGFPLAVTVLVGGLVLVAITKLRWLAYLGTAFLVLTAAVFVFGDLIPEHEIYLAQLREGCRSSRTDLMNLGLITAFAIAYAWLGYRVRRKAVEATTS